MTEPSNPRFYVCLAYAVRKAIVHRADCEFCNSGKGKPGRILEAETTRWIGPFMTFSEALARIPRPGINRQVACKHCAEDFEPLMPRSPPMRPQPWFKAG